MKSSPFSKWPGAWERHLIRRYESPHYFELAERPTDIEIANAQLRDQQELGKFYSALKNLLDRCQALTNQSDQHALSAAKRELDTCHDTAFGLATDLTEQKQAIASLNEIVTGALSQLLGKEDKTAQMRLMKRESEKQETLKRLEYPIVCDLMRTVSPIPSGEVSSALLAESDTAFKAALDVFDTNRKIYLAQRIDIIMADLIHNSQKVQALKKLNILHKQLPAAPVSNTPVKTPEMV